MFQPKKIVADAFEDETQNSYALVMPPPNANRNLHIGHGLTIAIEDSLARYYRLRGSRLGIFRGQTTRGLRLGWCMSEHWKRRAYTI